MHSDVLWQVRRFLALCLNFPSGAIAVTRILCRLQAIQATNAGKAGKLSAYL